jgi:formylmethanofuran dehydrogenase subunit B
LATETELRVIRDVACTVCGCVCDDLEITVQGDRIVGTKGACHLSEPWYLAQDSRQPPEAEIDGRSVDFSEAVVRAVEILSQAKAPLIYGLSRSSTGGQRAATRLADRLGATIDTTASLCHGPSVMAIQEVGESTCSLGEIKNRADLVVFWGCDPPVSHPRHLERYSLEPAGLFVPGGRKDRTLVVVDSQPSQISQEADLFVKVEEGGDFEAIWALLALVQGIPLAEGVDLGANKEQLVDLAGRLKSCRCGVFFFGLGLSQVGAGHRNVEAILRLTAVLNRYTRFHAKRMRVYGDVTGADSVLCWQTGFPFSVNLARGYPRYNPNEYSAQEVLERREADACLLVGSEGAVELSAAAIARLREIPLIVLDYPTVSLPWTETVRFTTAVYGVHLPGTAYRMDEIPIPLRAVLPAKYASDEEVLNAIFARL